MAQNAAVHAITDVTGFGLLGHGLELARSSNLMMIIRTADLPLMAQAEGLVQQGFVTGASTRNRASYGHDVRLPAAGSATSCSDRSADFWWSAAHLLTGARRGGDRTNHLGWISACQGDRSNRERPSGNLYRRATQGVRLSTSGVRELRAALTILV